MEWASQLAEANHPETGDWLYDDPIELAKAIRKGPDMPPVQPVADSEPVAWTWQHLKQWHVTNDEERARDLAWDGVKVEPLYRRAAMLQSGNSPAQSDCCPAQNHVSPEQSPIDHGYRSGCECSGCKATARICADLSARSPANPGCWCRTCRPVVLNDMRFVVCPDCGNKRCPRANDHRNACTGSNEPGQEGSAYPADPQEVK
ncbi:hypothetical protein [Klebsiella quasipneumoniae]|uniref:hypothetical protein n=1 Tax=Klebsiella quasipneumoniae TaxID=1463165 RepID=UPI003EB6DD83